MANDILTSALIQSMARNFSVQDLMRSVEMLKESNQVASIEPLYATWVQHNQDNPLFYAILFNYSVVLSDCAKLELARECLERAIAASPDFMPAYINLGRVYERLGNEAMAVIQWSAALAKMAACDGQIVGYKTTTLNQSARTLETANQDEAAESMLRQSLELDSHQREVGQHFVALRQRQGEWPVIQPSERVSHDSLMQAISPLSIAALTDDPLLQLALAWHYNKSDVGTPRGAVTAWPNARVNSSRCRVGYLSSDLREHAVGYLMTEVFALHDRTEVEVFAYYCGPPARDPLHEHFKLTVEHWLDISQLDDDEAAERMQADGIQILIDLNGYTREARLQLVAMRRAPVIVNWLGFPGTMGSPYHHYLVADEWIIPQEHELYYSERVLRLPCYQPSSRNRVVATRPMQRAEVGLPDDAMVYCCFNGMHKISRFTFERWLMILAQVPGSVLWLLGSTESANERLRQYAVQRGLSSDRLIFAEKLANPYHLARYSLADLFLDTTPYGAHTTASDSLWMGVPVLTLSGRSFASRVCGSLVRSAGIGEFVCESAQEFVERAVAFGNDPQSLLPYRERLRTNRGSCTLFDMPLLVHKLEQLYRQMWTDFQAGQLPRPQLTNLDVCLELGSQVNHEALEVQTILDYHAWWRQMLAERNRFRPIDIGQRLSLLGPLEVG